MIATIGVRSSGPIRSGSRRNRFSHGEAMSRRKSITAFDQREYGTRTPMLKMNDSTTQAMITIT